MRRKDNPRKRHITSVSSDEEEISAESLKEENDMSEGGEGVDRRREQKRSETDDYSKSLSKTESDSVDNCVSANSETDFKKKFVVRTCCLKNCGDKISPYTRQIIFENFWKLANFNKQNVLLNTIVKRELPKKRRPRNSKSKPREFQFQYYLTHEKESVLVCKRFFLDTFKISEGRLSRALKRGLHGEDLRGKSEKSRRRTEASLVADVKQHIESFPVYTSSYSSSRSPVKYLSPDLNIRKMFNLYLEKCKSDNQKSVNEWIYRKIFKNDYHLHFHQPRKDICKKCDFLKVKIEKCQEHY